MRANFSQVCGATTGQVALDEPRPISTSRQPVLPRSQHPFVREKIRSIRGHPRFDRGQIEADAFRAAQGQPAKHKSRMARSRKPRRVPRSSVSSMATRWSRRIASFCRGGGGMLVADAGQHRGDAAVLAVERLAALVLLCHSTIDRKNAFKLEWRDR